MRSVCTMALSLVVAGMATGTLAQRAYGVMPLPETGFPVYRTAQNEPLDLPAEDAPPAPVEDNDEPEKASDSVLRHAPQGPVDAYAAGQPQSSPSSCTSGGCTGGAYDKAMASPWGDDCSACLPSCCPQWFGSVSGLVMTRDNANRMWTSYETGTNEDQIMSSRDAEIEWGGGVEVRVGTCCDCNNAIEATYWGVYGLDGEASVTGTISVDNPDGTVSTPIDVTNGNPMIGGDAAVLFFDNSSEHRIRRENEFHNVELNWIHNFAGCGEQPCNCSPLNISFLAGFRYFRFDESFVFSAVAGPDNYNIGESEAFNTGVLDIDLEQNLWGFQLGSRADYRVNCKWNLYATPKVGVFVNEADLRAQLYRGDLGAFGFDIESEETDVSMLAQIDLGAEYNVSDSLKVFGGYRALAITGVALADEQIPPYLADGPGFADIDTNGSLILHGAFAGVEFRF